DSPGDDAPEPDDDFSDLVIPGDLLGKVKTIDRQKFSQELRGLLTEGMPDRGDGSAAARRHFESARRLVADDPRGPDAYGVALMRNQKFKEALEQFRDAARQSKAAFLPALHAVAWVHIYRNDCAKGIPAVLELVQKTKAADGDWPTDQDKEQSAGWVGR